MFATIRDELRAQFGTFSPIFEYVLSVVFFLFLFRLWKFTIRPLLHPNEPKELPYWIPYIGHTFAYMRSGHDVVMRAKKYFNNTREPFALQLINRKMYFILHPDDSTTVYRSTSTMSFWKIVEQLQRGFGISAPTMQAIWTPPKSKEEDKVQTVAGVPNTGLKSLADLSMDFWKNQGTGKPYAAAEYRFVELLSDELAKEVARANAGNGTIKLLDLIQRVFLTAGFRTFFGEKLLEIDPDFVDKFLAFEEESWVMFFKWPFSKKVYVYRRRIEESFEKWLRLPREERGECAYLVDVVETTQKAIGTSTEDIAKMMNLLIFVVNTNTYKAAYWAIAHMLVKPSIRNSIQMEVSEARQLFDPHELTKPYLDHLRSESPQMTALMHEALRCYTASSSIRLTLAPVPIGKRVIPTNSVVLVPFRPLHYDEEVFGSDVNTFNPDRFVKNKGLSNSQNFKPFSAGSSYCPGRKLATMEFIGFVAEMLGAYDVEVVGEMKVPSADERTPTKGIVLPIETEDLTLRISRKR